MALRADGIAALRAELQRVNHPCASFNVLTSRAVTPFTTDSVLGKGRRRVTVQRAFYMLDLAGMAEQAARLNWTNRQFTIWLITWRDVPQIPLRVEADRSLIEVTIHAIKVTASHLTGTDEVIQSLLTAGSEVVWTFIAEKSLSALLKDPEVNRGCLVAE